MKIGFSHRGFTLDDRVLAFLDDQRIDHVELRVEDISRTGPLFDRGLCAELAGALRGRSTSVHALPGINLGERIDRLRETCIDILVDQLDFVEAIGASWLTVHLGTGGFPRGHAKKPDRLRLAEAAILAALARTSGYAARLGLENLERLPAERHKTYLGDCAAEFEQLLSRLPPERVGVIFDIGHAAIDPERPVADFLESVRPRLFALHVHANDGLQDRHWPLPATWPSSANRLGAVVGDLGRRGLPLIVENDGFDDYRASYGVLAAL